MPVFFTATLPPDYKRHLLAALIVILVVCALLMIFVDPAVLYWVHRDVPAGVKAWFMHATDYAKAGLFLWVSAGLFGGGRLLAPLFKTRRPAVYCQLIYVSNAALFVFCSVALSGIAVNALKFVVGRYRPYELLTHQLYGFHFWTFKATYTSFPSGHAQVIWSVMTAFALLMPRSCVLGFPLAALLATSRVFAKKHYVSDILMGAFMGFAITLLIYEWFQKRGLLIRPEQMRELAALESPPPASGPAEPEACRA